MVYIFIIGFLCWFMYQFFFRIFIHPIEFFQDLFNLFNSLQQPEKTIVFLFGVFIMWLNIMAALEAIKLKKKKKEDLFIAECERQEKLEHYTNKYGQ